jgi:transposase
MADEDRLLVKLYYFDGLRLREAGAVLGVHEATASRRLTRIHSEIRARAISALRTEFGWSESEIARSLSDAAEHFDADLGRMFAVETTKAERREELYE